MGLNSRYGTSGRGGGGSPTWIQHVFTTAQGTITDGDPETQLIAADLPSAQLGRKFLITVMIFGDSGNTALTPNLIFRLKVDGVEISSDNLAAPTIDTETWFRGFSEETDSSTLTVEVTWEYTSGTPGAAMNCSRATLLIEEVAT